MRRLLALLLLICSVASTASAARFRTQAQLILPVESARPGETILAGVQLRMEPHWHTYWRNPGESGGATEIKWTLPEGVSAGEIQWPVPEKYSFGDMTTYVFHNDVVLLVPVKLSENLKSGPLDLAAKVTWLECEESCVPGKGETKATLLIGSEDKAGPNAELIETAKTKLPKSGANLGARIRWENSGSENARSLIIEWPSQSAGTNVDFFPFESADFEVTPAVQTLPSEPGKVQIRKTVKKSKGEWPEKISGLLVENLSAGQGGPAYEITEKIQSSTTAISAANSGSATPISIGLLLAKLAAAFLGGLILNVMPCVLPVISLKILGFVEQSKESPRRVLKLGFIYTLGVVVSFLVLAGIVIAVRQAGGAASWGMQMQFPLYRLALTIVATVVALNLFGAFEITLGGRAMQGAGNLAAKQGSGGAFFNGVLATALATPCTAPFLAPAVGFAFAQPPAIIILFFLAIALGLASPYLLLSWRPQWLRFLPKPGAWMEKFKVAMGFPMLATAVWLFSLAAPSFGENGVLGISIFLVTLAMALWIFGAFVQRGSKRKALATILALVVLVAGYGFGLEDQAQWRSPGKSKNQIAVEEGGIPWQPWSLEAVEKARAEGRPVLVDFTAKWCLTCQANKRSSIEIDSVRQKIKEINAIALLADNTDPDPKIAAELQKFDRAGVPLVLVYPKKSGAAPIVLPTLLTPGIMLNALAQAAE